MEKIRLGRTGMMVSKVGLGGVPLQRPPENEAIAIINRCLELGINFIDSAAEYSNCEGRIGKALKGRRSSAIVSTKSNFGPAEMVENNLKQSLSSLGDTYIDLYQFHSVNTLENYEKAIDPDGPVAVIRKAMKSGHIKHMGITTHTQEVAKEAIQSGIFETVMFPLNFIVDEAETELLPLARKHDVGFIAMKPLAAGMISNINLAFKYYLRLPGVMALPGIQRIPEIEEIAGIINGPSAYSEEEKKEIQRLIEMHGKKLCRRCGKCEPCPRGVQIVHIMDTIPLLKNFPPEFTFSEMISENLAQVSNCDNCGECETRCIYGLPVMELINEYAAIYKAEKNKYSNG